MQTAIRTTDLIHVTKDRTPSVMYKTINFSDLKSVDEWDKQQGTFAVYRRGREFDPEDKESHIIEVSADFTEERPFFALTEYLAWADSQIKQIKQWADKSQQVRDGKKFYFPWHSIKGDIRVEGNLPQQMRFELDRGRLLDLLVGHTIYNDATVAVRELLQNAIDAVRFQYHLELKEEEQRDHTQPQLGHVLVTWSPSDRELIVEDNGQGMDLDVIQNHLLRVGSSFYDTPQFQTDNRDFTPISKFGIGVLTCFMISDNIEIVTCRAQEGRRIRMTSVHTDYLLKDLLPGDPQLEGIEPNGTRVRLRLRPSIDLQEQSILDILRQWVILPVCDVIYSEPDGKEEKIGFKTTKEALQYMYSIDIGKGGSTEIDSSYEVLTVEPQVPDEAEYELAFIVRQGWMPERGFVLQDFRFDRPELSQSAAVCIEGIRADWHLPGFGSRLPALLSVRNNKKFRTTVSRSSLEEDEEYRKVGTICAEALFSHIFTEVHRISEQPGKPLSQASTAGRWLYRSLLEPATQPVSQSLSKLYQELPSVVVEYVSSGDEKLSGRHLSSLKNIATMPEFWTVESRAVDLLGIISRDLGRELDVMEFLGTLAPELNDPRVNPIIVDAHFYARELLRSHKVIEAEFSGKHQRTLLRWQPKQEKLSSDPLHERQIEAIIERLLPYAGEVGRIPWGTGLSTGEYGQLAISWGGRSSVPIDFESWPVSQVDGDIPEVHGVTTRIITVLSKDKDIGKIYQAINESLAKPMLIETADETTLLVARAILNTACSLAARGSRREAYGNPRFFHDPSEAQQIRRGLTSAWRDLYSDVNSILEKVELYNTLTDKLENIVGSYSNWFDASTYWRDWERSER